jgi:hypothetical protein
LTLADAAKLAIIKLSVLSVVPRRGFPAAIKLIRKWAKLHLELKNMVVIFFGPVVVCRNTEQRFSGDEFKNKTTKTPDVERLVHLSLENKLRRPQAKWGDRLLGRIVKKVGYSL